MSWYLIVKFVHIIAVALTIGGMFARQLVRGYAKKSDDLNVIITLTRLAVRIDRILVIPWSNMMIVMGIVLAVMQNWPVFGFLEGASQNWLLVSNLLLVVMLILIPAIFLPHNQKLESLFQPALIEGHITSELRVALDDTRNQIAHIAEEAIVLIVAALMVLKPF